MKSLAYLICSHNDSQLLESTHQFSLHLQTGYHAEGTDYAGMLCRGTIVQANIHLMDLRFISPHSTPIYIFSIHLNLHATIVFFTIINFLTCKTKHNSNEKKEKSYHQSSERKATQISDAKSYFFSTCKHFISLQF